MFTFRRLLVLAAVASFALGRAGAAGTDAKAGAPTATSPDGKLVATADGKTVHLFDAATGKEVRRLVGPGGAVTAVTFSPDGKRLATGDEKGAVASWDMPTGRLLARFQGNGAAITSLLFSADGKKLIARDAAKKVLTLDAATFKLLKKQ